MIDTQDNKTAERQEASKSQAEQNKMDEAAKNASETLEPKDAAK